MRLARLLMLPTSLALLAACGESAAPPAAPPPAVQVVELAAQPVATVFEFVARTRAREDTAVRARITGTILERNFEEGQQVEKDALLFRIDDRPYQAALNAAQATLEQARSAVSVAERNYERGRELVGDGYISQAEMDKLEGERDRSRAALQEAQAALEKARLDLEFTEIRAPFAGRAGRSQLSIGDLVDPSAGPLVTLVQIDPMLVDFDVNERVLAGNMKDNQERQAQGLPPVAYTPRLKLPRGEMYPLPGQIDYANNRVNPTTGTITVTASFPNPDSLLLAGQFVRIEVQRGEPEERLLLPQPSVLEDMQGRYVFVVGNDGAVARKNVTLGQREGTRWVVESGLEAGDRVIVNGVQKVRPGMQVTASEMPEQP